MQRIMLYGQFAEFCGVATPSISKAARKRLRAARVPSRKRKDRFEIDAAHPQAVAYYTKHRGSLPPLGELEDIDGLPAHQPDVDSAYMDWTLARIVATFGTDERFRNWLSAVKLIAEIRVKCLQTIDKEKRTICRNLVRQHIFGAIVDANERLLVDAPKTIARRVTAHVKSDGDIEYAERIVCEEISRRLRASKQMILHKLRLQAKTATTGD